MLPNPLLRAVVRFGTEDELALASNLFHLRNEIEVEGVEGDLLAFIRDIADKTLALPKATLVRQHFEKLRDDGDGRGLAGLVRFEEVETEAAAGLLPFETGPEFRVALDAYKQQIAKDTVSTLLLETANIMSAGVSRTRMVNGQRVTTTLHGPDAAVEYIAETVSGLNRRLKRGSLEGAFRMDADELLRDLEYRKANPQAHIGVLSGLPVIDKVHQGIGRGELALVLGFVGHLKSTFCLNWAHKAATWYGHNVCIISGETPVKKFRDAIYVMHAANKKFEGQSGFLTVDYEKVKRGLLSDAEEKFFRDVVQDFQTCPDYGEIFYREPEEVMTIADIMRWCEAKDRIKPVDLIFIDYLGLLDPGRSTKGMESYSALNMVIRQAKLMSMAFARGRGVAVISPFQANREGLKEAEKNGGRYSLRAYAGSPEAERSMDLGYYVYLDPQMRNSKELAVGNLKTRDVPMIVDQFKVHANPATRSIRHLDLTHQSQTPVDMSGDVV